MVLTDEGGSERGVTGQIQILRLSRMLRAQKRIARLSLKERAIIHILWLGEEAEAIVESHQVRTTQEREKDSGGTGLILSLMQSGPDWMRSQGGRHCQFSKPTTTGERKKVSKSC